MPHRKFLKQIAEYYIAPGRIENLADITFVFPNKRSAMFFRYYIHQRMWRKYYLKPRCSTFQRLAYHISGSKEPSRNELLFMLYNKYVEAQQRLSSAAAQKTQFDKFIFWGDMILDDFDVVDSSLADASKLYENLKRVKEITSDYLTPEQKKVIERFWGKSRLTEIDNVESFWKKIDHAGGEKKMMNDFVYHWEILSDVYKEFRAELREKGLSTPGLQLRDAYEAFNDADRAKQILRRKYVFVGLADVSNAEIGIMQKLQDAGAAEFFWDLASPMFYHNAQPDSTNTAIKFISQLAKKFPMPGDFVLDKIETNPQIDIIGMSSSVMQVKKAAEIIKGMELNEATAFNTAIVVPNPSQLMDLMVSLPFIEKKEEKGNKESDKTESGEKGEKAEKKKEGIGVNITMGIPYSTTTFATLFSAILSLHHNSRRTLRGERAYYFKDVLEILLHPHIQLIAPTESSIIRQYISERNMFTVDANMITKNFPGLEFIFKPINLNSGSAYLDDITSTQEYLEGLIAALKERLETKEGYKDSFEMKMLDFFSEEINKLKELMEKYHIDMKDHTFLSMFERIMMSKTISMEGTPLRGLQVMGVLETRCLDFDNMIFLAMNERSFPKRDYVKTMIPNNLRRGYGLPSIEHTESFYSYYFFRAISRAKKATLLYDSRPPGRGRGEMSRYLEELIYIFNEGNVKHEVLNMSGSLPQNREITIEKTPDVMKKLEVFKNPKSKRNLSASSLKKYLECPLKFYLMTINGLSNENEPTDYFDAAQVGDIFHRSAKDIYDQHRGELITEEVLEKIIHSNEIEEAVIKEIAKEINIDPKAAFESRDKSGHIQAFNSEANMMLITTKLQLKEMFESEKNRAKELGGYTYEEGECEMVDSWTVGKHTFNFTMLIDRIDRIDADTLCFIDYKTGKDLLEIKSLDEIFEGNYNKAAIFQLLTYASAYKAFTKAPEDITFSLYVMRMMMQSHKIEPIKLNKKPLPAYSQLEADFNTLLEETIDRIFNDTTPFTQCDDPAKCRFCPFLSVCGRTVPKVRSKYD